MMNQTRSTAPVPTKTHCKRGHDLALARLERTPTRIRIVAGEAERQCCRCLNWLPQSNEWFYLGMAYCKLCARAYGLAAYYRRRGIPAGKTLPLVE